MLVINIAGDSATWICTLCPPCWLAAPKAIASPSFYSKVTFLDSSVWESILICARGECVPVPIKMKVSSFCPYYIMLIKIKPACLYSPCTPWNWIQAGDDMQTCDTAPSGYRIRSLTSAHGYTLSLQKDPKQCRLGQVFLWMLPWDHERCKK